MSVDTLPEGWKKDAIGNLIESSNTGLVRGAKDQSSSKQFDYFKMNNLNVKGDFEINNLIKVDASEDEVSKFSLNYNDFIFNTRNSVELVGKCGVFLHRTEETILFNNNLLRIRFHKIEPKIIAYWFNSAEGKYQLRNVTSATTSVAAIYQKALVALDVPVPPLAEQKEIAKQLDSLLAKVDSIKNRLDAIPDIIKRFRQSVLSCAVSGKLSEEWRSKSDISIDSWTLDKAKNLCIKVQSGSTPRNKPFDQGGKIPFLKVYNIVEQKIDFDYKRQFITEEVHSKSIARSIAYPNDILMNIVGPPLGKVAVLTNQFPEWNLNQAITLFRVNPEKLNYKFLYHVLCEGALVRDVMPDTKGSVGQVNISLSQCRDALIPAPTLPEQDAIVSRIDQLFSFADKVEQKVIAAQDRVNNLTQSILAKAFRGELTTEWRELNQALITGENSAEALLAKIKAEREALSKKKAPKKKTTARKTKA